MPKIGVIDSGVGGLSVLRQIHQRLPGCATLYYADQGHVPYGPRPHVQIDHFIDDITRFLWSCGADVIVLACHAASAASLHALRQRYPHKIFVGVEPAVKPAVTNTQSGIIGVLTTQATADGLLYRRVLQRFARDVQVITQIAPELVLLVEQGKADSTAAFRMTEHYLQPMLTAGADQIVLACTHFPFLAAHILAIAGDRAALVDPGPAVARQVMRVLPPSDLSSSALSQPPTHQYFTSGDCQAFLSVASTLMGHTLDAQQVLCGN